MKRANWVRRVAVGCLMLAAVAAITEATGSAAPERRRRQVRIELTDDDVAPMIEDRNGRRRRQRVPLVRDFNSSRVIFPEVVDEDRADAIRRDPRFRQQYLRRHGRRHAANPGRPSAGGEAVVRDWSYSLNNGSGGTISAPAKYVFDITAAPSCANDFVVTGVNIAGSATQANLIGFNSLYNMPAGNGLCPGTAPNVLFAYNIGPGAVSSVRRPLARRHENRVQRNRRLSAVSRAPVGDGRRQWHQRGGCGNAGRGQHGSGHCGGALRHVLHGAIHRLYERYGVRHHQRRAGPQVLRRVPRHAG